MSSVIVIPGNPEDRGFVCISSPTRPDPMHCWLRAEAHCFRFKEFTYFEQLEAATACRHMAEAIMRAPRPPQRAVVSWGWGKGWPGMRNQSKEVSHGNR